MTPTATTSLASTSTHQTISVYEAPSTLRQKFHYEEEDETFMSRKRLI